MSILYEAFADDDVSGLNLEDYNVPLTEWISKDTVGDEIKWRFRQFLRTFQGRGAVAAVGSRILADA